MTRGLLELYSADRKCLSPTRSGITEELFEISSGLLAACKMMADRLDFCGNTVYFGDTPDDMYIFDPNDVKMIEQAIEEAENA